MDWIISYGMDKVVLTEKQVSVFKEALKKGLTTIEIDDMVLSNRFMYILPSNKLEPDRLSLEELHIVEKVAEWLSRDALGLDFTKKTALEYAKKNVKRIGSGQMIRLFNEHANGAYPNARRFLSEISQNNLLGE